MGARAAGVLLVLAAALSGCTHSAPRPSGSGSSVAPASGSSIGSTGSTGPTTASCRWGATALRTANRALALSGNAYELIDTATLKVLRRCEAGPAASWGLPSLAEQGVTYRGSKPVASDPIRWPGVLRPGGADGSVVVVAGGVLDLATGVRTPVRVTGFAAQSVGRDSVVMVSTRASGLPPSTPSSWCVAPLAKPTTCSRLSGAAGPGTPVVGRDGRVAWLPVEVRASTVPIPGTRARHLIRSGAGVVTAVGVPAVPNGVILIARAVAPDGRAFVTVGSLPTTQRSTTTPDPRITWYGADGTVHRARATWIQAGGAAGVSGAVVRGSLAVSSDGRTLYVVIVSTADARKPALVAVTDGGGARLVGTVPTRGRPGSLQFGDELLTTPTTA